MNNIREVFITKDRRYEPIVYVYGSMVPIELHVMDFDLPAGTTAKAFAEFKKTGTRYENQGTVTVAGNKITFTPDAGLFNPGANLLQVKVGNIRTFLIDVLCQPALDVGEIPENPFDIKSAAERVEAVAASIPEDYSTLSNTVNNRSMIVRSSLTAGTDMDNVVDFGTYLKDTNVVVVNGPGDEVIQKHRARILLFTPYNSAYARVQMWFDAVDNTVYTRIKTSPNIAYTAWERLSNEDTAFEYRRKLTAEDDVNTILKAGIYFIDTSYPANLPENVAGRLIVFNGTSALNNAVVQMYFGVMAQGTGLWVRISRNTVALTQQEWVQIHGVTASEIRALIAGFDSAKYGDPVRGKIPLLRGTFALGQFAIVDPGTKRLRIRSNATYRNVARFHLSDEYEIKFYYYSEDYRYLLGEAPAYTGASDWQSLGGYPSPDAEKWFAFMVRMAGDAEPVSIGEAEADVKSRLEYVRVPLDNEPFWQTETLPPTAELYHAKWDELLDSDGTNPNGRLVKRVPLGTVQYDGISYPIHAYELHLRRDWIAPSYGVTKYNGSNELYERPKILITAGMHGNEKNTPMDVLTFARELISGRLTGIGGMYDWYFIPLVNPWGYSNTRLKSDGTINYQSAQGDTSPLVPCTYDVNGGIRYNGDRRDLNRDFADKPFDHTSGYSYGFQTQEAQVIHDYILSQHWKMVIDVHQNHEDRTAGATKKLAYCRVTTDPDNHSDDYADKQRRAYRLIDKASAATDSRMIAAFKATPQQYSYAWRSNGTTSIVDYFGGRLTDGHGNTDHDEYVIPYAFCAETSETSWSYCHQEERWYNACATSASADYTCELISQLVSLL